MNNSIVINCAYVYLIFLTFISNDVMKMIAALTKSNLFVEILILFTTINNHDLCFC